MRESKIDIRKNLKVIQYLISLTFLLLFSLLAISIFVKFNFYITGNGIMQTELEIPILSKFNGKIVDVNLKNGEKIFNDQIIANVKCDDNKIYSIKSPKSGELVKIGDADMNLGSEINKDQICGILIRRGLFFKAFITEIDVLDLKEGQDCLIRITAFDKVNYPPFEGKVFYVSEIPVEQGGVKSYPVFCTLNEPYFLKKGNKIGMSGVAKIQKGKSTVFNILFGRREREEN